MFKENFGKQKFNIKFKNPNFTRGFLDKTSNHDESTASVHLNLG